MIKRDKWGVYNFPRGTIERAHTGTVRNRFGWWVRWDDNTNRRHFDRLEWAKRFVKENLL